MPFQLLTKPGCLLNTSLCVFVWSYSSLTHVSGKCNVPLKELLSFTSYSVRFLISEKDNFLLLKNSLLQNLMWKRCISVDFHKWAGITKSKRIVEVMTPRVTFSLVKWIFREYCNIIYKIYIKHNETCWVGRTNLTYSWTMEIWCCCNKIILWMDRNPIILYSLMYSHFRCKKNHFDDDATYWDKLFLSAPCVYAKFRNFDLCLVRYHQFMSWLKFKFLILEVGLLCE